MFKIRRLKSSDAKKFHQLRLAGLLTDPESFASDLNSEKKKKIADVKSSLKENFLIGAFDGANLVGSTAVYGFRFVSMSHKGKIGFTYVLPEFRRFGLGRKLMEFALVQARKMRFDQVQLDVVVGNNPAIRLYKSLGFVKWGTEKKAIKIGKKYLDEIHMAKFF